MSSEASNASDEEPNAIEIFERANGEFQAQIEDIDDGDPGAASARMKAIDEFLSEIAAIDPEPMIREQTIAIVADSVGFMTKSRAEEELSNHISKHKQEQADRPDIADLLNERVTKIEKLISDESESEARYRFIFDDGSSIIIDSEALYSPTKFRRAYNGVYDVLPRFDGDQERWENLLHELQQDRLVAKPDAVGPRSAAIQQLRSKISKSEAYLDAGDAIRNNAALIDVESREEAEDADRIWLASDEIRRICDDKEITPEALRIEMDNRGLRKGTSVEKRFGGNRAYFWPLDADEFEPKLIETDSGGSGEEGSEDG